MKRIIPILLACLCLTACQRGTTMDNTSATGSTNVSDSTIVKCIADYWRQRYNTDEWYEEGVCSAQQPDTSGRLYEAWYDVTGYLVLVNLQDTTVADFLEQHPIVYIPEEYINLTDSTKMLHDYESKYRTSSDTVICEEYNYYVLYKYDNYSKAHNSSYDTLLIELSETRFLMADKFVRLSQKDTIVRHYDHVAKSYFNERDYNEKLYWLHKQIMAGDSIPDEQLLDAMPKNSDQFLVYYHEYYPYNDRSFVIDSLAVSRAKENPLFCDAYITMFGWADGWPAEIISEVYCPMFFYYDSVYFRDAIRRILPEYIDMFEADYVDTAINDVGWLRWVREHKEEIISSLP